MKQNSEPSTEEVYLKNAVWDKDHYKHFGIHPNFASIYGSKKEDIQEIKFKNFKKPGKTPGKRKKYEAGLLGLVRL